MQRKLVEKELLDTPGSATSYEIEKNLKDIAYANRWLGGTSVVIHHLSKLIHDTNRQPITIIDMATGCADIPVAIVNWGRSHGVRFQIKAVDKNPVAIQLAKQNTAGYPEINVEQQDVLNLPYKSGAFDYAICSQAIHHLENAEVIQLLQTANRLTTCGIVVSDFHRTKLCIRLASLASHLIKNRLSAHDSRVSFKNAFMVMELKELAEEAGLPCFKVYRHNLCRLVLLVDKRTVIRVPKMKPLSSEHVFPAST